MQSGESSDLFVGKGKACSLEFMGTSTHGAARAPQCWDAPQKMGGVRESAETFWRTSPHIISVACDHNRQSLLNQGSTGWHSEISGSLRTVLVGYLSRSRGPRYPEQTQDLIYLTNDCLQPVKLAFELAVPTWAFKATPFLFVLCETIKFLAVN